MDWNAIRAELAILRAGLAHAGDLRDVQQRAIDLLAKDGRDAEAMGALAALTLGRHRDMLNAHWLKQGAAFAIACATWERRFVAVHPKKGAGLDLAVRWIGWRTAEQTPVTLDAATWLAMNAAYRKIKKADRPAAEGEVRAARGNLVLALACWVDSMALLADEAADDALRAVDLDDDAWSAIEEWVSALVPALATSPSPKTRKAAMTIFSCGSGAGLVNRLAPHAKQVVDLLGADAAAPLAQLLDEARDSTVVDPMAAKKIAQVLATIDHPVVEAFFVRHIDSRVLGTVAAAYVTSRDTAATDKAHARALAIHEAATTASEVRSRRAKAAAKKTSVRRKRTEAVVQAPEASPDDLPWVLRHPPWRTQMLPPMPNLELEEEADESDAKTWIAALTGKRAELARKWIAAHPDESASPVLSLLSDPTEKLRALEAIAILVRAGHTSVLRDAAVRRGATPAAADEIARIASLLDCPDSASELPEWVDMEKLPPVVLANGARLSAETMKVLVEMLTFADPEKPYAGHAVLKQVCERTSLDALLVRVLELGRKGEDWTYAAAAAAGGPDAMRALAKKVKLLAKQWSARDAAVAIIRSMHVGGLDAVEVLGDIARKVRGDPAEAAQEMLAIIAKNEGLSAEELADIATPTLDLDPDGRATLDFGPRTFRLALGNDLDVEITGTDGKRVPTLRKAKGDDPAKAQIALERSRSAKKALGEIARSAALRFEMGMIAGRTFRGFLFRTTLVAHPILGRLVRRLVWADAKGSLFRVAEDGTFADHSGHRIEPRDDDVLRIPHPLDLDASTIGIWGDVLAEHEIIQPFPQIGRLISTPTEEEQASATLSRFSGTPVKQMAIQGRLAARGWEKLVAEGWVSGWFRRFRNVTAHYALVDPIAPREEFQNETTLGPVSFGVALEKVPPLVFSETAYDFHVFGD